MSCTETIKHLYEFVDNEVDKSNYFTIKRHIEHCKDCRQRYEFEKGIRAMIKAHCINVTAPKLLHNKILNGLNSIDLESHSNPKIKTQVVFSTVICDCGIYTSFNRRGNLLLYGLCR
jgi:mycothiol system anti-sigma-R factor